MLLAQLSFDQWSDVFGPILFCVTGVGVLVFVFCQQAPRTK